ncbi:hypothetical protein IWQ61_009358 [Dispira simplex]|nr:hypothetical protein IWQ61_009358 [Dispira simplex]
MRRSKRPINHIFNEEAYEILLFFAKTFGDETYHRFILDEDLRKYIFSKNVTLKIRELIKWMNDVVPHNKIMEFLSSPIGKELVKELSEISGNDDGIISNREVKIVLLLLAKPHHYVSDRLFSLDKEIRERLYSKQMAIKILEIIDNDDGKFNLGAVINFFDSDDGQRFKEYLEILSVDDDSIISDEEVEDMLLLFAGFYGYIPSIPRVLTSTMPHIPRQPAHRIIEVINKKEFDREEITKFLTSDTGIQFTMGLYKVITGDNGAKSQDRLPEREHATTKVTLLPLFFLLADKNWLMGSNELNMAVSFLEEASNPDDSTHV